MVEILMSGLICDNDTARMYRYFGWDAACPLDFRKKLAAAAGDEVKIIINSNGGDMTIGTEIAAIIEEYGGNTVAITQGKAASAATLAMTGAKIRRCNAGAVFCIHNPWMYSDGDYREHALTAESLLNCKNACLNLYEKVLKDKSRDEISELMNKDIWINAQQALEYGLVDEIITGQAATQFAADAGGYPIITAAMRDMYTRHVAAEKVAEEERENGIKASRERLRALMEN